MKRAKCAQVLGMELRIAAVCLGLVGVVGALWPRADTAQHDAPTALGTTMPPTRRSWTCDAQRLQATQTTLRGLGASVRSGQATLTFSQSYMRTQPPTRRDFALRGLTASQQAQVAIDSCNLVPARISCCGCPALECDASTIATTATAVPLPKLALIASTFAQARLSTAPPGAEIVEFGANGSNNISLAFIGDAGNVWTLRQQRTPPNSSWGLIVPECGGLVVSSLRPLGPMLAAVTGDHSDEITYFDSGGVAPVPNLPGTQSARH
jgi:hypothetical protein